MKHIFLAFTLLMSMITMTMAQTKDDLVYDIQQKHYWLPGKMVENFVTLNVNEDTWTRLKDLNAPIGATTFSNLGNALVYYLDLLEGTMLKTQCGFSVNGNDLKVNKPTCEEQIAQQKGKISITLDASAVKINDITYRLIMGTVSTVTEFLGDNSFSYLRNGWRPRAKTLDIVIAPSDKVKTVTVTWTPDGSKVTIVSPVAFELPGWSDMIVNGLNKGGKR